MKIAYLIRSIDRAVELQQSIATQASVLSARHDVEIISVYQTSGKPFHAVSPQVRIRHLVGSRNGQVEWLDGTGLSTTEAQYLQSQDSLMMPPGLVAGFNGLTDMALDAALQNLDADVLVTLSPALLSFAVRAAPSSVAVIHQEQRASRPDSGRTEALQTFAPLADMVTVLNSTVAGWVRAQMGPSGPPVEVVPHPVRPGFRPQSRLNTATIAAAGPLTPEKGFVDLVRAFSMVADNLPGWRLRIFGSGPRRRKLEALTRKFRLFDRVELPGTSPEMADAWAMSDVAAVTSRTEALPLAAQEAMAAGVPVVSYDCPSGPRHLIEHGRNGLLVPPESVDGLASALLEVGRDDELRRRLGQAALEHSEQFHAARVAETWERHFERVASPDRARRAGSRLARVAESRRRDAGRAMPEPVRTSDSPEAAEARAGSRSASAPHSPAQARHLALRWAVSTAEQASAFWLVIPPAWTRSEATVVVPANRRTDYLELLTRDGAPDGLILHDGVGHGWPESSGPLQQQAQHLRRGQPAQFELQIGPAEGLYCQGCRVRVEFWDDVNGTLSAPEPNVYTAELDPDQVLTSTDVEGVKVQTLPIMAEPTVLDRTFPVDVVYTWVDGADPAWASRRRRRLEGTQGPSPRVEASGAGRYTSRDELRHSLRSVHLFAPWVRHIYLVTDRQVPSWLDTSHPQVTVVDHADILPGDALPTFNSHAIETGLHRIEHLSDQFIYLNDDVFLGRPLGKDRFFSPSGSPAAFMAQAGIGLDDPEAKPYLLATFNNREVLRRDFGRVLTNLLHHTPHPLRRSLMVELETRYPDEFRRTATAPFRSPTDIAPVNSFAQHYSLITGQGYLGDLSSRLISLNGIDLEGTFERLLTSRDTDTFCLNDYHEYVLPASTVNELANNFLADYYPVPAPWEKAGD
jgi:hypothetical protein